MIRKLGLLALTGALVACGDNEVILQGERLSTRDALFAPEPGTEGESDFTPTVDPENRSAPVAAGAAQANAEWTHRNGSATHRAGHPALGAGLQRIWSADIGAGSSRRARIATDPVVGGGLVFVMDAAHTVSAVTTGGGLAWQRDMKPGGEQGGANGGGLAYGAGRLYATTGYGEVSALDAASGSVLWTVRLDAPVAGAPTFADGTVYVAARNATGWALDAATGKQSWSVTGAASNSGAQGSAGPAVDGPRVLFPLSSGELVSADRGEGTKVWSAGVAGKRLARGWTGYTDISADPVVLGGAIVVGNATGRVAAFHPETGERLWSADEGATGPVWAAGGDLFFVNDENRLTRLDAASGEKVWAVDLPYYTDAREKRRARITAHYGPVLAGGRLVVASSDGLIRSLDPASGALLGTVEVPGGAAGNPAVAGGVMYVIGGNGQLHAFR